LQVYSRADLSRTVVLVVALLLTADTTGVFAREFWTGDPCGTSHTSPFATEREQSGTETTGPDRTNVALNRTITPLLVWRYRKTERT